MSIPTILTIAGSDSSGGAGIQADLKAIAANGGYGASVLTAVTAQNTLGISASWTLPLPLINEQLDAVFSDLEVEACKSGMLGGSGVIETVARFLETHRPAHYICDPVMNAKDGYTLLPREAVDSLVTLLCPLATLLIPNAEEAAVLAGFEVRTPADAEKAGRTLLETGASAVLIKGGHLAVQRGTDVLVTPEGTRMFSGEMLDSPHTHGTGCTFSAALATRLALGEGLEEAVTVAKEFISMAIRHGLRVGGGIGPTDPFFFLRKDCAESRWLGILRDNN